jgi:hypothetical protein
MPMFFIRVPSRRAITPPVRRRRWEDQFGLTLELERWLFAERQAGRMASSVDWPGWTEAERAEMILFRELAVLRVGLP